MELMPGYKHTEIGVIPKDWTVKPLGSIGEAVIGLTYDPSDLNPNGRLVLRASNIQNGRLSLDDNVFVDTPIPDRLVVRQGDILICVRNGSRRLIGKCALIDKSDGEMTFGAFMSVFRTPYPPFVLYQLQSDLLKRQIEMNIGATINQITNKDLASFLIPVPPLAEQRAIAEALSDVDAQIASLDALIVKQRALKQAAMQELLTGRTRLPGFSGEWEVQRIGDIAMVNSESLSSGTNPEYAFDYIAIEDVDKGKLMATSHLLFSQAPSRARRVVRKGDVLFGTVRPNLQSHFHIDNEVSDTICSTGFAVVRCKPGKAIPAYLYAHLFNDSVMDQIESVLAGSSYPAVNGSDVADIKLPFPSLDEQNAIATVLSDLDAEIVALEAQRDKTRLLKQAMMQELLTGRTRLQ